MSSLKHSTKAMTVAQNQRMSLAVSSPKVLPPSLFISLFILLVQNSEFFFFFFNSQINKRRRPLMTKENLLLKQSSGFKQMTNKQVRITVLSCIFYALFVLSFPVLCTFLFLTKSKGESFIL